MAHSSKRYKAIAGKVDRNKIYPIDDALGLVKEAATAKFDESIDVAVNLGIDAKKSDQAVRGSVVLHLLEVQGEREACRTTVELLAMAHERACEAELAGLLAEDLTARRTPCLTTLRARFSPASA